MLVLTRNVGEIIHVGQDIEIAVLAIRGKQIRIGVAAPRTLRISRSEPHKQSMEKLHD